MKRKVALPIGAGAAAVLVTWISLRAFAWPFAEGETPTLAPLLGQVTPAVVNVAVVGAAEEPTAGNPLLEDPFFRRFFEGPDAPRLAPQPQQSIGSGVIVDAAEGLIVTNHHVVQGADSIVVTLNDRRRFDAKVVGSDEGTDVAVLRVDKRDEQLSEIPFGDSDKVQVGDYVVAIGNPFGLGQTATSGIVSALGRSGVNIESYEDFIQTDASINPGNSGGALVGLNGQLLGVNTAILSSMTGGNIGIGFAIPSNMVRDVVDQLVEFGNVRRGRLGIVIQDVTPDLSRALELGVNEGALVTQVEPGSPAEAAGIEAGDVVVAIDGETVRTSAELRNEIGLVRVNDSIEITTLRGGERRSVTAKVAEAPDTPASSPANAAPEPAYLELLEGAELTEVPRDHPAFGSVMGVFVAAVANGSPAWRQGLRADDIIISVNRRSVASVADLATAISEADAPIALAVQRDGRPLFLLIR